MPLCGLWETATNRQIMLYGLHCFAGDLLISMSALVMALLIFGTWGWPVSGYARVAAWAVAFGFGYTVWSKWFLGAGKKRLAGDTARQASSGARIRRSDRLSPFGASLSFAAGATLSASLSLSFVVAPLPAYCSQEAGSPQSAGGEIHPFYPLRAFTPHVYRRHRLALKSACLESIPGR